MSTSHSPRTMPPPTSNPKSSFPSASKLPILILGAGPTGLSLSLWLTHLRIPHRLLDRSLTHGTTSRAMIVHARTLEYYRQLSLSSQILSAGIQAERMAIASRGAVKNTLPVAAGGEGMSRFPVVLSLDQGTHEGILEGVLEERGGKVERGCEVVGVKEVEDNGDCEEEDEGNGEGGVEVRIRHLRERDREEVIKARYVVGCDGAHSIVRREAEIKMEGGTYALRFFVADIECDPDTMPGGPKALNMNLSEKEYCMLLPMKETGGGRLISLVPRELEGKETVEFEDVLPVIRRCIPQLKVKKVKWFSAYRVHHRTAENFRKGRLFLCGDACHLHSPVGGQGMNTGIGDAANLAWKLAAVYEGRANEQILDTYESERIGFARTLVNTTDKSFSMLTNDGWIGWFMREYFMPYVVPFLSKWKGNSTWETTSQINLEYKSSELSFNGEGYDGATRAGNRLPFVRSEDGHDNFETLEEVKWQVHVYGEIGRDIRRDLQAKGLEVRKFEWSEDAGKKGLVKGALYLVRPEGYIGAAVTGNNTDALFRYMERWGLKN